MKPTRGARLPQANDSKSQCRVATAAMANSGLPVLYMLLSTLLLTLLCMLFAQSFGPEAWSKPQHLYKSHHLSHVEQSTTAASVMRI